MALNRFDTPARSLIVRSAILGLVVLATQYYAYIYTNYDISTLAVGVALPLLLSFLLFHERRQRVLLYSFSALFLSIVDDAPVNFDSVYTWPEVTGYHPFLPHFTMEVILHVLTALFIWLALRQTIQGRTLTRPKAFLVSVLGFCSFIASYSQNIPLQFFKELTAGNWYLLDTVEHLAGLFLLAAALVVAGAKQNEVEVHSS